MKRKTSKSRLLELILYDRAKHDRYENLTSEAVSPNVRHERVNCINLDGLFDHDIIESIITQRSQFKPCGHSHQREQ
jgi:hypothetical protein